MSRRRALVAWGALALLGDRIARAQPAGAVRRIGVLEITSGSLSQRKNLAQGLHDLGWVQGRNVDVRFANADGDVERADALIADLLAHGAEVLVVGSGVALRAAQRATRTLPIVMVHITDPVGNGFIASLARPGGNTTGVSNQHEEVLGKLLEIVHELAPAARRIAVLLNETNPSHGALWSAARNAAAVLGLKAERVVASAPADLAAALSRVTQLRAQALIVTADPVYHSHRAALQSLLQPTGLPVGFGMRDHVEAGGLVSYGVDFAANWRYAAKYIDLVLKGAQPGELPVEQPRHFELVINRRAAQALHIRIPQSLLMRANTVIE